jgi:hypothetical protein
VGRSTLLTALVLAPIVATAAVPTTMPLHGVLRDQAGVVVEQGTFELTFTLYDGEASDTVIWTETWPELAVNSGAFAVVLGSVVPLTATVFVDVAEAWMGISVTGEPELPRQPMGADAFAFVAGYAGTADTASAIQCSGCCLDNDCNGEPDHGLPTLTCGKGNCAYIDASSSGGQPSVCDPLLGKAEEVQNGLDNDCDSSIDEGVCAPRTVELSFGSLVARTLRLSASAGSGPVGPMKNGTGFQLTLGLTPLP